MKSCFSGTPRLPRGLTELCHMSPLSLSSWQPTLILSLGSDLWRAPGVLLCRCVRHANKCSRLGSTCWHQSLGWILFYLLSICCCAPHWGSLSSTLSSPVKEFPSMGELLFLHSSLPDAQVLPQYLYLLFLISSAPTCYVETSLPFWKSEVFYQPLVGVL